MQFTAALVSKLEVQDALDKQSLKLRVSGNYLCPETLTTLYYATPLIMRATPHEYFPLYKDPPSYSVQARSDWLRHFKKTTRLVKYCNHIIK